MDKLSEENMVKLNSQNGNFKFSATHVDIAFPATLHPSRTCENKWEVDWPPNNCQFNVVTRGQPIFGKIIKIIQELNISGWLWTESSELSYLEVHILIFDIITYNTLDVHGIIVKHFTQNNLELDMWWPH